MAEDNPRLNRTRLDQIVECSHVLLDRYDSCSSEQRALIIGALRYFVLVEDTLPDGTFTSGLDDDAKIFNYVLEALGVEGSFIPVS